MKKVLGVAAIAALFAASTAMAATLELRVVTTGEQTSYSYDGVNGEQVPVLIQARLTGASEGLALWGSNLKNTGTIAIDLCDDLAFLVESTAVMAQFDRVDPMTDSFTNYGLTNPRAEAPVISGYSGTCDGAMGLWQLGGGQNTIGNTVGGATYPIGTVDLDVANSGTYVTIADGFIEAPIAADGETIVLALDTAFANVIVDGEVGPAPFPVEEATVVIDASLTLTALAGIECDAADVNCDGSVNGLDIAAVKAPGTWQEPVPGANEPRGDVNGDGAVNGLDIAAVKAPGTWQTSTGPCNCP